MRTLEERNEIVKEHLQLAESLARKRYKNINKTVQYGELLSAAYSGLLDAAQKYTDSKANVNAKRPFEVYAKVRIWGEMTDYLRTCNWGTRNNPQHLISLDASYDNDNEENNSCKIINIKGGKDSPIGDEINREEFFNKIIKRLSPREKIIFKLRYLSNLKMDDIAKKVDLTESRVSQILSDNCKYLKETLIDQKQELWSEIN